MPRLRKSLTRIICPKGHDLTGSNRRPNGTCGICVRRNQKWKGNPVNREKTHCPHGHPYSGDNLGKYKRGYNTIRYCRACRAKRAREYYWNTVKPLKHPGPPGRPRKYESA